MTKPILIVKIPNHYSTELSVEIANNINNNTQLVEDYHIFTIPNNNNEYEFKVFNGEYTEAEYEKLKNIIDELKK